MGCTRPIYFMGDRLCNNGCVWGSLNNTLSWDTHAYAAISSMTVVGDRQSGASSGVKTQENAPAVKKKPQEKHQKRQVHYTRTSTLLFSHRHHTIREPRALKTTN